VFAEAEEEFKEKGPDRAGLHVIIFDEVDALMRKRGSRLDSSGVLDSCVTQLLSKIDGLTANDNMYVRVWSNVLPLGVFPVFMPSFPHNPSLVIGTTNRKDLLDDAVLRPGRLEVHVEVNLPDEPGRARIFQVHTAGCRREGCLGPDVDVAELARRSQNFTGAEIEGVVKVRAWVDMCIDGCQITLNA
jgi:vesicle-fusing ATPase